MALVYKRTTENAARRYDRSPGMEPNPGVSTLAVVNPGRAPRRNPFQWISGKGVGHVHESAGYATLRGALRWKGRTDSRAKLYPVDEHGTVLSRPVNKRRMTANRRTRMSKYNIGALRRAMRANGPEQSSLMQAAKSMGVGGGRKRGRAHRKSGNVVETLTSSGAVKISGGGRKRGRARKYSAAARRSLHKTAAAISSHRKSRRSSGRKSGGSKSSKRSRAARKAARTRAANKARRSTAARKAARTRKRKGGSRKSRKSGSRKSRKSRKSKGSRKSRRGRKTRRGGSRKARRTRRGGSRKARRSSSSRRLLDQFLAKGLMPKVARHGRLSLHRGGAPSVLSYARRSRLSGRRKLAANRRRHSRRMHSNRRHSRRSRRNGRRSRRSSRRGSRRGSKRSRRGSRRAVRRNSRRSRRSRRNGRRSRRSRRNGRRSRRSRRNGRRRSRRVRRNTLVSLSSRRANRKGGRRAAGGLYQMVELGSRSFGRPNKHGKRSRMRGYPVMMPASITRRAYIRKFRFGGAARDAHRRAMSAGYRPRRKYARSRKVRKNSRRHSMRRNRSRRSRRNSRRSRRNPKYVLTSNRRHSRRSRRNGRRRGGRRNLLRNFSFGGVDLVQGVLKPVAFGTGGFIGARLLSNGLARMSAVTNILDKGMAPADASNTKIVANLLGIVATLGLSMKVNVVKQNRGALVTGMGLALVDRLLAKFGGAGGYLGEYVSQPLGEYVTQPLGEYISDPTAGMGEYVEQPLGEIMYAAAGLGEIMYATAGDPANQDGVDRALDLMEGSAQIEQAAAGVGTLYAAAGMGINYATAGLGEYADNPSSNQLPFVSIGRPVDAARTVTGMLPYTRPVPNQLVSGEAKGRASKHGIFANNVFDEMGS